MEILIMGIALGLNIVVILFKVNRKRYLDASIDGSLLVLIGITFSGTITGLMMGTVASSIVSIYLLFQPPKLSFDVSKRREEGKEDIVDRLKREYKY